MENSHTFAPPKTKKVPKNKHKWCYRLGVRTSDFHSGNPGSIPGSTTKKASIYRSLLFFTQYSCCCSCLPGIRNKADV